MSAPHPSAPPAPSAPPSPSPPLLASPDGFVERPGATYIRRQRRVVPQSPQQALLIPQPPLHPTPPSTSAPPLLLSPDAHPAALQLHAQSLSANLSSPSTLTASSPPSSALISAPSSWWLSSWISPLPPAVGFFFRAIAIFGLLLGLFITVRYLVFQRQQRTKRAQRLQRQRQLLSSATISALSSTFTTTPGCVNCTAHYQQHQLLRRLCQLVAARSVELRGLQLRKDQLLVSTRVAYTETEATVVAMADEIEALRTENATLAAQLDTEQKER